MVFCNKHYENIPTLHKEGHNPYFNRWFSAIRTKGKEDKKTYGHNPYFNRWFSAMYTMQLENCCVDICHNPYFNRWFSAIQKGVIKMTAKNESQSLF